MSPLAKKILKILFFIVLLIVVLLIVGAFWLYSGELTPAKIKAFETVPYPMVFVNGDSIPVRDFIFRQRVSNSLSLNYDPDLIYEQQIAEEKLKQLASSKNVSVSKNEIKVEFEQTLSAQPDIEKQLKTHGLSVEDYKNKILRPELLKSNLKIWFNAQSSLNSESHKMAESILKKIQSGENMAALASAYTQDTIGKSTQGDLGYVDMLKILPELREPVSAMKVGEAKILPSRLGLHIIKIEDQDGGKFHLRQIFINTGDFENWVYNEGKGLKVIQIYKI